MPETRFFHAGLNVYKFKIKYGNTISINTDLDENIVSKEIQTKKRNKFREIMDIERATKQRRLEEILETSHTQHYVNRNLAENAIFMNTSQPNAEFGRTALQKDMTFPVKNQSEETKYSCCSSLISTNGYNVKALGQHTEINRTKNAENYKQERHMLTSQNRSEQRMEMKKKGFLEHLKSALFSLFL
ncbi:membrane-anchored junction protein [Ahaetulla prasina]|uniref:membrane-anchored junction protein n=1 Tax=Ahaetulla prasina TaxID=499056 RepID=UPI002649700E|nr:membrane-anchored junction protein [Ahaetulla prasina]